MSGTYTACGEIDMATASAFADGVCAVIDGSDEASVVVDCSDVTFLDSAGYHALVDATQYAVERGQTLMICNMSASCALVLRLCDGDGQLHMDRSGRQAPHVERPDRASPDRRQLATSTLRERRVQGQT